MLLLNRHLIHTATYPMQLPNILKHCHTAGWYYRNRFLYTVFHRTPGDNFDCNLFQTFRHRLEWKIRGLGIKLCFLLCVFVRRILVLANSSHVGTKHILYKVATRCISPSVLSRHILRVLRHHFFYPFKLRYFSKTLYLL